MAAMICMQRMTAAALAATLAVQASTAGATCLTEPQFRAAVRFVAPDLIRAAAGKCAALLPAGSYLGRNGMALAERFRPGAATAWPDVRAAMAAQPDLKLFSTIDEGTAHGLLGPILVQSMTKENFKVGDCRIADEVAANLDPLPPENMIALIATVARLDKGRPATTAGGMARAPILCPVLAR